MTKKKEERELEVKEVHPVSSCLGSGHKPLLGKCPRARKVTERFDFFFLGLLYNNVDFYLACLNMLRRL